MLPPKTLFSLKVTESLDLQAGYLTSWRFYLEVTSDFDGQPKTTTVGPLNKESALLMAREYVEACLGE